MTEPTPTVPLVNISIDGKAIAVPKGWTLMQAAVKLGTKVPHFCWHPGLSIAGVCRFCMVKVDGRPKLEIACNTAAVEGMKVFTDIPEVKETHKWALEFHLINHPLDCPICDQAGECGLQDYYMEVGRYHSAMTRPKVLKPKAIDVGGDLVLDTERCILCTRCVRFEEEVTKTTALGIFDRGDRSVIGIYPGKKIQHNYTTNLVDICPVGAFTSKDFRFKQRVWFLQDKPSICPGCSTGCAVDVFGKEKTGHFYRIKPRQSDVNGHWMCDKGRHTYAQLNPEVRLNHAVLAEGPTRRNVSFADGIYALTNKIKETKPEDIALLVSAQYTNEEYREIFGYFVKSLGVKKVFQWREPTEKVDEFDGMLYRGDHNANTAGLLAELKAAGITTDRKNQFDDFINSKAKLAIAFCPELPETFPSLSTQLNQLGKLEYSVLFTMHSSAAKVSGLRVCIPTRGFAEKTGTFTNFNGVARPLTASFKCTIPNAHNLVEIARTLSVSTSPQKARVATGQASL